VGAHNENAMKQKNKSRASLSKKKRTRKTKPSGPKGGRPELIIDWEQVENLCRCQCTEKEISSQLGISVDTLQRAIQREKGCGFADYFAEKRQKGFVSLRTKQFSLAMTGDKTMLVWLGKQYLNQRDKSESSGPNGGPILVEFKATSLAELAAEILQERNRNADAR
jgi:AraC-like DNA-binding protein